MLWPSTASLQGVGRVCTAWAIPQLLYRVSVLCFSAKAGLANTAISSLSKDRALRIFLFVYSLHIPVILHLNITPGAYTSNPRMENICYLLYRLRDDLSK